MDVPDRHKTLNGRRNVVRFDHDDEIDEWLRGETGHRR